MAQHDYNIANQTFPNTRTDINNALSAVASNNSGTAAPSTTFANQWFYETDTNLLQIRNEDNDAYITIAELDQSNDTVEYFKSDSIRTALIEFTDGDDAITIADGGGCTFPIATTFTAGFTSNDGCTITTADADAQLTIISTESGGGASPIFDLYRNSSSPADADVLGQLRYYGENNAGEKIEYVRVKAFIEDVSDGDEGSGFAITTYTAGSQYGRININEVSTIFNENSADIDFRVESNSYPRMFQVDAGHNEVQVTDGSSFYDTDSRFSIRTTTSNTRAVHISTSDGSYTQHLARFTLEPEESSSAFFQIMSDYNDFQISFRGDGNGFFDGAADAGNADFAEYFESTDGSAIAIGKTVVLDNGKVRASTDSDNAADIVGVVRHRKTVGIIGNSAWSKWKGKYKVDDYGVPLRENYTLTKWVETYTEDKKDCTITYNGNTQTFDKIKGEKKEHSYQTDKIPSEVTAPSDATVVDVDNDGNKLTRKILSDSYDASKTYVSREDRDEWNLIGLTGQVTMTKGQKTGDRWIKMRDISDDVEEWLVR